ncbi:MAG: hypothetical protein QOI81_323 [Actinomycetota bacterium]|nr:hypothetical protein [Actinomycetota bacterium]
MPFVARFNVAPVKSAQLQHPELIELTPSGAAGDRRFLFLDPEGHRFAGEAKAGILGIGTRYAAETDHLTLTFPDGYEVGGPATPSGQALTVALYDHEARVRAVEGPFADAVTAHIGREVRLARMQDDERAGGLPPVSLVSLASVADLAARGGVGRLDPRRFRMLIELDGCDAYEEDAWAGRVLRIGQAELLVRGPTYRCTLTNLDPDTGERDFPTLDLLATYRRSDDGLEFGRYADVRRTGRVKVGDQVEVLAPETSG